MVKCDKDDKGKDHSIVSDDATNLRIRHFDNVFEVRSDFTLVGKKGVYLKLLMKVHVKKVPKKRMTERKNMSGTYSQEWERTPMNLRRSVSIKPKQKFKKKIERINKDFQLILYSPDIWVLLAAEMRISCNISSFSM